jgi:P-type Cu+ transporter
VFPLTGSRGPGLTISVVIVAGACGIAAGTPLAILGGIGRAARLGAIIKGGLFLELLGKADTVVLDKTGTLTFGAPAVQTIIPSPGVASDTVIGVAASAELRSEHPLGKTIVAHAQSLGRALSEPERFGYTPGRGIDATIAGEVVLVGNRALMYDRGIAVPHDLLVGHTGGSELFVARGQQLLGAVEVADTVRPEARQAVDEIHRMGIRTILLTGDTKEVADAWLSNSASARWPPSCCPSRNSSGSGVWWPAAASSPWWATASTTRRRSPRERWRRDGLRHRRGAGERRCGPAWR